MYTLEPKPRGKGIIIKTIRVDEDRIEAGAQKFFDTELDESSPYFILGVFVYTEDGTYQRYIENPAIDPFEGL